MALEGVTHSFLVTEAAGSGDLVDVALGVFEHSTRGFKAEHLDGFGRGSSGLAFVDPGKIAWAHPCLAGQSFDGEVVVIQVFGHPGVQFVEPGTVLYLQLQQLAELRLSAGALEKHHQLTGHLQGHVAPTIGLDQCQGHVDAGADTGRGPHGVLLDEDRVQVHFNRREAALEHVAHGPMGGGAASVQ